MFRSHRLHLSIIVLCLLGPLSGCREEPRTEDFGEVIYKIPEPPAAEEPATPTDRQ